MTLRVSAPLLRAGAFRARNRIAILMYHSIACDPEPGISSYYRVTTSPNRFREQMGWLRAQGYRVIPLSDVARWIVANGGAPHRAAVITFDDGFLDFASHAWPILRAMQFPATVFLPTSFMDAPRRKFTGRDCLSWPEVRALREDGVSFGSHTVSHPKLYQLSWTQIRRELRDSRIRMQDELQDPTETFAYPYAFPQQDRQFVKRLCVELADAGYRTGVTTIVGRAGPSSDLLALERLPVNQADDEEMFLAKLAGAYDWVGIVQRGNRLRSSLSKPEIRSRRPA